MVLVSAMIDILSQYSEVGVVQLMLNFDRRHHSHMTYVVVLAKA